MQLSMDHRWGRRKTTDSPVRFFALPATFGTGRVTNVSVTGAFMETLLNLPLAGIIYVESIAPVEAGGRRRMAANVVRCTPTGVGLEWCQAASNSVLYSQFGSAYRDRADFSRPEPTPERSESYLYQFDFQD
jgi:hypothetical protein